MLCDVSSRSNPQKFYAKLAEGIDSGPEGTGCRGLLVDLAELRQAAKSRRALSH
jgi:hypothetical protein